MQALMDRLKQGSSHAGLAAVAQVLKVFFPAWAPVFDAGTLLLGSLAVALNS